MIRIVLDTNILVADAYAPDSASARLVAACLDGRIRAVVSPALIDEYAFILPRAVRRPGWRERLAALLASADWVEPEGEPPRIVAADPSDDMLFAAALIGGAAAIVSSDAAVLSVGEWGGVQVVAPGQLARELGLTEGRSAPD